MNAQEGIEMTIGMLRRTGATGTLDLRSKDGEWLYPVFVDRSVVGDMEREMEGKAPAGGSVRDILASTIANLNAKVKSVRVSAAPRGRVTVEIAFDHEGKESVLPARAADAVVLARRLGAPIYVSQEALKRDGFKTSTGAEDIAKVGPDDNLARLVRGFRAMGRIDEAILAAKRLLELHPKNESWHAILGELYAEKGWLKQAAQEMAMGMIWYMRQGYLTHAVNTAKEIGALDLESLGPKTITAPAVLEDFESPEFNNEWLAGGDAIDAPEGAGGKCYRDKSNLAEGSAPWFILSLLGRQIWRGAGSLVVDTHLKLKAGKAGRPVLECSLDLSGMGDRDWVKAPPVEIKPGWNRCAFPLNKKVWSRGDEKLAPGGETIGPVINIVLIPAGLDDKSGAEVCFSKIRLEA